MDSRVDGRQCRQKTSTCPRNNTQESHHYCPPVTGCVAAGILCHRQHATREAVTIVIHNAVIATVDDQDSLHYGAAIAIDGDRITAIGPSAEILARHPARRESRRHGQDGDAGLRQRAHAFHHDAGARRVRGSLAAAQAALLRRAVAHPAARHDARRAPRHGAARRARGAAQRHHAGARGHQRRRRLRRGAGRHRHALPAERAGL